MNNWKTRQSKLPFFNRHGDHHVTFRTISVAEQRALPHADVEEPTASQLFQLGKALILTASDLTEDEFNTLTAPDFNQLFNDISEFVVKPSDELSGTPIDGKTFEFDLLFPFKNELGESIQHIQFQVPKVKHSEALLALDDEREQEDFMFRVVCALEDDDLSLMALNDYLAIKPQIQAFFQLGADYFPPATLKH